MWDVCGCFSVTLPRLNMRLSLLLIALESCDCDISHSHQHQLGLQTCPTHLLVLHLQVSLVSFSSLMSGLVTGDGKLQVLITQTRWFPVLRSWLRCLMNCSDSNRMRSPPGRSYSSTNVIVSQDYLSAAQQGAGRVAGELFNIKPELFRAASINLTELTEFIKDKILVFFPRQAFYIWRKHERKSGIFLSPWDKYFIWKYNLI